MYTIVFVSDELGARRVHADTYATRDLAQLAFSKFLSKNGLLEERGGKQFCLAEPYKGITVRFAFNYIESSNTPDLTIETEERDVSVHIMRTKIHQTLEDDNG